MCFSISTNLYPFGKFRLSKCSFSTIICYSRITVTQCTPNINSVVKLQSVDTYNNYFFARWAQRSDEFQEEEEVGGGLGDCKARFACRCLECSHLQGLVQEVQYRLLLLLLLRHLRRLRRSHQGSLDRGRTNRLDWTLASAITIARLS